MTDSKPPPTTSAELLRRVTQPEHPSQDGVKATTGGKMLETCNLNGTGINRSPVIGSVKPPSIKLRSEAQLHDLVNELADEARIKGETEG